MIVLNNAQLDSVGKMHNGCILCGRVGSGKSRTALAYFYKLQGGSIARAPYSQEPAAMVSPCDLYVITTAKKRDTREWDKEMIPFLMSQDPELNFYKGQKVVVDSWNNIKKYEDVHSSFFIFDEQRVVGYGAWTKSFLKITKKNRWILLSATPGDKWEDYMPVFIANGFYKNKSDFQSQHMIFDRWCTNFPKVTGYVGVKKLERLRDQLLIDIPVERITEQHHEDIYVDYDKEAYKQISKTRWNPYKDEPIQNAAEYCYCLRRLVNTSTERQTALLEILEKHPKAIIFYNMDCELDILKQTLGGSDYVVAECNGHRHDVVPDAFDKWCYLVQYNSGAEGWNCITTDTIIFYSPNYSYRIMQQAAGRIDRMNTTFVDLWYYHLMTHSNIDNAIAKALRQKKQFNETKFSKDFFATASRKEVL